jgi:hypothetical protein
MSHARTARTSVHSRLASRRASSTSGRVTRRIPKPESGYAYKGDDDVHNKNWKSISDEHWDTVMIMAPRAVHVKYLGRRDIDGSECNVWRIHDGYESAIYAQTVALTG